MEKMQFRTRLDVGIGLSFPFIIFVILSMFTCWKLNALVYFLGIVIVFLIFYLRKITVDETGFSDFFFPRCYGIYVKWEDIEIVKPSWLGGVVIRWHNREKSKFLSITSRRTVRIEKEFRDFKDLLRIIITKSSNAKIDPRIYNLLEAPDRRKITKYGIIFGASFLIVLPIYVFVMKELILAPKFESLLYYIFLISVIPGGMGFIFSTVLCRWDREKWQFFSYFFYVYLMLGIFIHIPLILSDFSVIIGFMKVGILVILFSCVLFLFPHLKRGYLAILFLGLVVAISVGHRFYSLNSRVRDEVLGKVSNFASFGIDWFPDGSKFFVEGYNYVGEDSKEEKLLIFDVNGKRLTRNMPVEKVFIGFSFFWAPDGKKLALIEFPEDKESRLSIFDADSLDKNLFLEEEKIWLHRYGCWNQTSDKLVGIHGMAGSDKKVPFIIEIPAGKVLRFQEKDAINAFWLPDGSVGILQCEKKGKNIVKYSMVRIDTENFQEEVIYVSKDYLKSARISPHGSFLMEITENGEPLLVDVFNKKEIPIGEELALQNTWSVYWTPDESYAALVFNDEGKNILAVYDSTGNNLGKVPFDSDIKFISWSADSKWFLISWKNHGFLSLFLVSRDCSKVTKIGMGGLFDMGFGQASVNRDGSKVVYHSMGFNIGIGAKSWLGTTIHLSEIRKD